MKKILSSILVVCMIAALSLSSFAAAPSWPVLKSGSSGADVYALQYLLVNKGYSLTVDGQFGNGTETAVKNFQKSNNLSQDGIVGENTWKKLIVTVQNGSNNSAVKALQYQLKNKYGFSITVDGAFGNGTQTAVTTFQKNNNISADGIVGATTWQYLLGGTGGSNGGGGNTSKVTLTFNCDESVVSTYTKDLIKKMLSDAGLSSATVTSTIRTPYAQASAMYTNCVNNGPQSQFDLYGPVGDKVIQVYVDGKKAGYGKDKIIQNMVNKINDLWPSRVSLHCVPESEYKKLNVLDIGMSSISNKSAFEKQLSSASSSGKISYIKEPENGCYHIEVPQ